jgi:hypothetical protein
MRSHTKIRAKTQPPAPRQRSSDSEEELRRRTRQGWRRRRSPNGPPVASHRTPPGPCRQSLDFTSTNKPRQTHGHVEEEPTTATKAMPPTSLISTIVATEASTRTPWPSTSPACRCPAPKMKPPRGNTTPKAPPSSDHTRSRVSPRAAPSASSVQEG